ncbi:CYTH domain-containing protein [Endozoicomonas sp.]|nr:CYTH domain-containing protein [Endozoicomonas sp.]
MIRKMYLFTIKYCHILFFFNSLSACVMSQEIELKLSLSEEQAEVLAKADFWRQQGSDRAESFKLSNIYFDTPGHQLNKANIALRIREKNGHFIQTLKTQDSIVNGLFHRGEWEWSLQQAKLDLSLLDRLDVKALEGIDRNTLEPLFSTDFQRTRWVISWGSPAAKVEAALDKGYVNANSKKAPICELELLEGDQKALRSISEALSKIVHLTPIDKSKAERGFELLK